MTGHLATAGEMVAIECANGWVADLLEHASAGELKSRADRPPTAIVEVEPSRASFSVHGWEPITRGAYARRGEVVVENVMATGFDLRLKVEADVPHFVYRYRPPLSSRAIARALRDRFVLLARAALLQYPAIWRAGIRHRTPIHAVTCTAGSNVPLLAGPAGVGKSTLVEMELAAGGSAVSDNLCVSDGVDAWGVVEPSRTEGGRGRRTTHGRREGRLTHRTDSLRPTAVIVVRRQTGNGPALVPAGARAAAAALIAGTYMAGELRRYWSFAATLSLGAGWGPAHPPVEAVSRILTSRLPAFELHLVDRPRPRLSELLQHVEATL